MDKVLEHIRWAQGIVNMIAVNEDLDDDVKESADCARHHLAEATLLITEKRE